jgi:hypothetical protein
MRLSWSDALSLVFACILITAVMYRWTVGDDRTLVCTISSVDGERYCVRDRKRVNDAVDLLAVTSQKMTTVVDLCRGSYIDAPGVARLCDRYNAGAIKEVLPTSEYTAYSENKGEKMAFCVNVKRHGERLIDQNTLTFVALHELAHVMSASIGHTPEFWKNFKFLVDRAVECGVYSPVDYSKKPAQYCGMELTHNPYYS